MSYRFGIQIISYNRPEYLDQTLQSLMNVVDLDNDKIAIIEQSDDIKIQKECISICQKYNNINVYPLYKNLGQRGATNYLFNQEFFNDCDYIMLSDHDNIFHDNLNVYKDILDNNEDCWIASGLNSPEHDIENKKDNLILKSTCRAGHIVMRAKDFLSLMPLDPKAGSSAWYCGLDWSLTHWSKGTPGYSRTEFIYCLSGGVEHIGKNSTWQGKYDDEYSYDELIQMRDMSLYDLIKKYPPRHTYINNQYWYEKLSEDEFYTKYSDNINTLDSNLYFDIEDFNTYPDLGNGNTLAFNYIWPQYSLYFLKKSVEQALKFADKYFIIINEYSYIGNKCPLVNISKIIDELSIFKDKVVIRIYSGKSSEYCQKDNIGYHFNKVATKYYNNYKYLWLVQSDEIYDDNQLGLFKNWQLNFADKINNNGWIMNPICYIDTPNWRVYPIEDFQRLTYINLDYFKNHNFNYNDIEKQKSEICFHHFSYVMTNDELFSKFNNWGHRNDMSQNNRLITFVTKLDKLKTDKSLINLHPVIPNIYESVKYVDENINNDSFIEYIKNINLNIKQNISSISYDINNKENYLSLDKKDQKLLLILLNNLLPSNPNILIIDEFCNGVLEEFIKVNISNIRLYCISPVSDNKLYYSGIKRSVNNYFYLYNGNYKLICSFENNYFDMIFFNISSPDYLNNSFIESWPKIKNYGLLCGNFSHNTLISNLLYQLIDDHNIDCPWGNTPFRYYEKYLNLSESINSNSSTGIWLSRIKKR